MGLLRCARHNDFIFTFARHLITQKTNFMNAKIKTLFFALFWVVSATVNAQDAPKKYEYVIVSQQAYTIYVSYAGRYEEKIKLNTKDSDWHHELLAYVENLQNDGWQVFSTSQTDPRLTFVLRRLKK